ncbi:pentatricopeptide repeat-containing protein At2g13600-like isoform X2 [Cryptomeria japonica]|uniref:pentatricopeptide repeat-containing protein At2g13600-like isoform X2 n=1 Tax=Cryptomeria japonica TaxID=3369 RepID=UPI0027DA41D1|nr:pentatricopeptide repeat-containing protein At2g13600-like isoform X2 [Cryptomeria japonica]
MYGKCGSIQKVRELFDKMQHPGAVSWNVMIAGYAMHGYNKHGLNLFEQMNYFGTKPDPVSFICVLFACSHAGLVDDGCKYFNGMSTFYSIIPRMDHYVCMVDLLGRAGYLVEAFYFVIKMPLKLDMVVWMCLLGACRSHKNIGLGEFVARLLFELDTKNAAPYVLLSNISAEADRWDDVHKVTNHTHKHRRSI